MGEDVYDEEDFLSGLEDSEIIGDVDDVDLNDLLSGDELDIVGASAKTQLAKLKAQNAKLRRMQMQALARQAGGATIRSRTPTDKREQWLPIGPLAATAAGAPWAVTLIPVRPCRLDRPIFPAAVAAHFDITTYQIGGEPQLLGAGNIPLDVWAENANGTGGLGKSVNAGVPIILAGNNIDPAGSPARILRGAIRCTAIL